MRNIYLLIACFIGMQAQAQIQWQKHIHVSDPNSFTIIETPSKAVQTQDGGYLIAGTSTDNDNRVAALLKVNANGDSQWVKKYPYYGGPHRMVDIFYDNQNNLIGVFEFLMSGKGQNIRFARLDESTGDTISSFLAPKTNTANFYGYRASVQLSDGSYILVCQNMPAVIAGAGIVIRFMPGQDTEMWEIDSLAQKVWVFNDIIVDGQDIVMTGHGPDPQGTKSVLIAKYDIANGKRKWNGRISFFSPYNDTYGRSLLKNSQGNYVVAGQWRIKKGPLNIITPVPAFFVFSSNGDSLAINMEPNQYGGELSSIIKHGNGFLAAGRVDSGKVAPDANTYNIGHMALFAVNDDGTVPATPIAFNDMGWHQGSTGSPYLNSYFTGRGVLPVSDGILLYGTGNYLKSSGAAMAEDTYLVKLNKSVNVPNVIQADDIAMYPNPVTDQLIVNTTAKGKQQLLITNIVGQHITTISTEQSQTSINTSNWAPGTYLVQYTDGKTVVTKKIVKAY